MAKISMTPRSQAKPAEDNEDTVPESIFDALKDHPLGVTPDEPKVKDPAEVTSQVNVADLLRQMAEMKAELGTLQSTNNALLTTPPQYTPTHIEPQKQAALPDPVNDPDKYAEAIENRIMARQAQEKARDQEATSQSQRRQANLDRLWQDFSDKYPDIADDDRRLQFVVKEVAEKARSRGQDLDRLMFVTSDRFMADVAREYTAVFGEPEVAEAEVDQPVKRGRPRKGKVARQTLGEDDDEGRTAGIFGGTESGSSPSASREKAPAGDMIRDLHDLQRKGGFY